MDDQKANNPHSSPNANNNTGDHCLDENVNDNDEGEGNTVTPSSDTAPALSKNQLKKMKKREQWLKMKQERRKSERQKKKQKLVERRERGEEVGPSRKKLKTHTMENSSCKIRVALDLTLDQYMNEKDARSLVDQMRYCYSDNRRASNPMQLYLCGSSGKCMPRLQEIGDVKNWDVFSDKRSYDEVFPKEDIVYLSSESQNVLSTLSEDKVYVIGGLVDHNQQKGLCHRLAEEKGIAHAQLPIQDYFYMNTRKVFAVNHVFSILLKYTELNDWKESFLRVMPTRIQAAISEKKSELHQEAQIKGLGESEKRADDKQAERGSSEDSMPRSSPPASENDKEPCCVDPNDQQEQTDCVKSDCNESSDVTQQNSQENDILLASQDCVRNTESLPHTL